jgi:hypothetical protein
MGIKLGTEFSSKVYIRMLVNTTAAPNFSSGASYRGKHGNRRKFEP